MKKIFLGVIISLANFFVLANNLAGTYECKGHDSKDGDMKGLIVTLVLDNKNSDTKRGFYSYLFNMNSNNIKYKGSAVSSGNSLALAFYNINKTTDNGVGLATVLYDLGNNENISNIKLNKFYYEAEYGSHGFETCIKIK